MKKLFILLAFISIGTSWSQKSIQDIECITKLGGTRFVTLLSDNSVWWSVAEEPWSEVPRTGLPTDKKIASIHVYLKLNLLSADSTLIAVLDDSTLWWFNDNKWESIPNKSIKPDTKIKMFKPYVKFGSFGGTETRFFMLSSDNTLWWSAPDENFKPIDKSGLPANVEITNISTYQKFGMMGGSETRYVVTLADNTVWWYADGKKWEKTETDGLPSGFKIANMTTYLKTSMMGGPSASEGRLVLQLEDNSVWWKAAKDKGWRSLETGGLPKGQKIKSLEIYQKFTSSSGTRVILVFEDNSIWWYAEKQGWQKFELKNLLK
ncbi:hypothetical protein [Flavobacterium terrisoli]|uniref:hypothetical protein n=1 Tax=Flavobacterium terrisoli TaxID=3242195 RepID=UPI002543D086|nr:hypothetical protein [Flavobacterium buctense]